MKERVSLLSSNMTIKHFPSAKNSFFPNKIFSFIFPSAQFQPALQHFCNAAYISLNPHSEQYTVLLSPFYKQGNQGSAKLNNIATEQTNRPAKTQTQVCLPLNIMLSATAHPGRRSYVSAAGRWACFQSNSQVAGKASVLQGHQCSQDVRTPNDGGGCS